MSELKWVPDPSWAGWIDLKEKIFTVCSYKESTSWTGEKSWMIAGGKLNMSVHRLDYMPEEELRSYLETIYKMQGSRYGN